MKREEKLKKKNWPFRTSNTWSNRFRKERKGLFKNNDTKRH